MARCVKTTYTAQEIEALKQLIQLRVKADRSKQKHIRDKMRDMGFYGSEFGIRDCHVSDLERLINCGIIKVVGGKQEMQQTPMATASPIDAVKAERKPSSPTFQAGEDAENSLINGPFVAVSSLNDGSVPNDSGLYCIKLRKGIALPTRYGDVRDDGIIYIGQAVVLKERLWDNELNHEGAATFFRGVGAMLGYLPPRGSLIGKKNQNNYRFSPEDTECIRQWMRVSLLVNWIHVEKEELDNVEKQLIKKYCPIFNNKHNPLKNAALEEDRAKCRENAKRR